jgi:NADH dehydrogenase FAD-containing subunit
MAQKQPHILIVGGAYGGLSALNNLISLSTGNTVVAGLGPSPDASLEISRSLRVPPRYTLLDERDGFYHTVGAPLGQISPSYAQEFWLKYEDILRDTYAGVGVRFIQGTAVRLSPEHKHLEYSSENGVLHGTISFDYLIVATGMRRGLPVVPGALDKALFLDEVNTLSNELQHASGVVVIGGGKKYLQVTRSI